MPLTRFLALRQGHYITDSGIVVLSIVLRMVLQYLSIFLLYIKLLHGFLSRNFFVEVAMVWAKQLYIHGTISYSIIERWANHAPRPPIPL